LPVQRGVVERCEAPVYAYAPFTRPPCHGSACSVAGSAAVCGAARPPGMRGRRFVVRVRGAEVHAGQSGMCRRIELAW